jgi:16S rRNA (cytosine967-C5)-methyltransferase
VKPKASSSAPSISPARAAAFDILIRIDRESSYASELLHAKTYANLSSVDHNLATELVMGVLRWRLRLDSIIAESSSLALPKLDAEVLTALRLAVYQFLFLTRIPVRAAIHESVQLVKRARKRSAVPFANAVLRKIAATPLSVGAIAGDSAPSLAAESAHPNWLVERWIQSYGLDAARRICSYNQSIPTTALRLRHADAEALLRSEGIEFGPGELAAGARRVLRGDVTCTSAFRDGLCAIQDEGSQLVAALVGEGENILDGCAAPGGKTLAIADRNPNATVIAAELHPHRARLLTRLIHAHAAAPANSSENIHVITADARHLPFTRTFDRVLVDAPCSGTGTLARNPEIKWRLTPEDLLDLQARQLEILRGAMAQVALGGRLIYSTCSLEREENENVVALALAGAQSFRVVDCQAELGRSRAQGVLSWPNVTSLTSGLYLRTLPGIHPCDGFFAAILERI